jgi:competence protein ComEA
MRSRRSFIVAEPRVSARFAQIFLSTTSAGSPTVGAAAVWSRVQSIGAFDRPINRAEERRMSSIHSAARADAPCVLRRSVQVLIASLLPVLAWAGPVDINKADAATIAKELKGIGLSRAHAIVAYREKNGAFRSVDDLRKVKGIGVKVLEQNRQNIQVEGGARK